MIFKSLIFILLVFPSSLLALDNQEFEILNSNNGLSSEEILDIFQDGNGYIWFLTNEGLNRYDGYSIKTFKPGADGLEFPTASFECIGEDYLKRLWLGTTEKGVLILDKNRSAVTTFFKLTGRQELNELRIRSILADSKNNVWIGTEYGLYKYQIYTNQLDYYNLANLSSNDSDWCIIESLMEDSKGNIWIATWSEGLFVFHSSNGKFENYRDFNANPSSVNENRIKSLFEDRKKGIWVGTWEDGLYRVKLHNKELVIEDVFLYDGNNPHTISGDIVYTINQDLNDNLWIGTPYGLTIIEKPYNTNPVFNRISYDYNSQKGLSNNEVWKIYEDNSGLMWIGTLEGGVNKVHPNGKIFDGYDIPPVSTQIQSQTVKSFSSDPDGSLLIGVKSLGFGIYDLEDRKYRHYSTLEAFEQLPENINTVNCFYQENNRYMWLGTRYNGLIVFDYQTSTYSVVNEHNGFFSYEAVNDIYCKDDSIFWIATEDGLYTVKRCGNSTDCFTIDRIRGLSGDHVLSVMEDDEGNIWIGTAENGINKISIKSGQSTSVVVYSISKNNAPSNAINCVYQDSKGSIWAGSSDNSLLVFKPDVDKFLQFDVLKDSRTDAIFCIAEDGDQNLWLTTNGGLTRLDFNGNKAIADSYTVTDGLQGNIFVPGAIYTMKNRIFVGSYFGFNTFIPSEIALNDFVPQTRITEMQVNNQLMQFNNYRDSLLVLKYNQNNLTFRFSAMSFYKPEKNLFAYKMVGYDQNWQYADAYQRGAQYANLQAGTYTFMLKSTNSSGLWNEVPVTFSLEVLPAPWKTWWAYLGYFLAVVGMLVAVYRFLLSKERIRRQYEIQKIEHAKTERLNQFKLSFFTNISHELLTPLSIMSCAMEIIKSKSRRNNGELIIMDRNMSNLHSLLKQLLDFRKMEEGQLKLLIRKRDFQSLVEEVALNFTPLAKKKNIKMLFSKEGEGDEIFFDPDKIEKILRNIISNAVKYTLKGGSVMVLSTIIHKEDGFWAKVSVSDTGIGIAAGKLESIFTRFYRDDHKNGQTGFGIGLDFTKRLVEMHRGQIHVTSELGIGTSFIVEIPLSEKFYTEDEMVVEQAEPLILNEESIGVKILVQADEKSQSMSKVKLLIVDDNPDFRDVLKTYFADRYFVELAENGEQALKMAINTLPDLIISDVMMPKMNGYDLCIELKNNIDTKYIPVILLTSKSTVDEQTYGYKVGADSYITKPVSLKMLESRISALLLKRHEYIPLQKLQIFQQPKFPKLNDAEFIAKVETIIRENLSEPEFTVKELAGNLGLSNSMLYRKVTQITNLSPVNLIKRIRLNNAASLLKKGRMNVSEVAYETGFTDQSYFTLCFKKKFGHTPSQYIVRHSKNIRIDKIT